MKRLAHDTVVLGDEDEAVVLPKGSVPPAWAKGQITNPSAYLDDGLDEEAVAPPVPASPAPAAEPEDEEDEGGDAQTSEAGSGSDGSEAPAKNASTADWAAYAAAVGVEVPEGAKRADIQQVLKDRGFIES